jgi:hypothetical protein
MMRKRVKTAALLWNYDCMYDNWSMTALANKVGIKWNTSLKDQNSFEDDDTDYQTLPEHEMEAQINEHGNLIFKEDKGDEKELIQ